MQGKIIIFQLRPHSFDSIERKLLRHSNDSSDYIDADAITSVSMVIMMRIVTDKHSTTTVSGYNFFYGPKDYLHPKFS